MKQILLSFIILLPLVTSTMENPTTPAPTDMPASSSMISPEKFIEYMNAACACAHGHSNKVRFCTYSLGWAIQEGNNQVFDGALYFWNHWKAWSIDNFTRDELACPFVTAASKGYWYGAQKLLERSKGTIINDFCYVPSHKSSYNTPSCVAVGSCALALAAKNGHGQFIVQLFEYKSPVTLDVDLVGSNKKTPLMEAIEHDKLACTQSLLQGALKKANPNFPLPDKSFGSILHWALSLSDRTQHVKALIDHGADINLINVKNNPQEGTPLMVAMAYSNLEGVRLLLAAKAKIELKHPFNKLTAKELAMMKTQINLGDERKKANQEIVMLLTQAEAVNQVTPGA